RPILYSQTGKHKVSALVLFAWVSAKATFPRGADMDRSGAGFCAGGARQKERDRLSSMEILKSDIGPSAVHLCIDMQRLFDRAGPWPTPWMPRVLPVVVSVVEHAASRTVFTRFVPPRTSCEAQGKWRPCFEKWSHVTRAAIASEQLALLPALIRFVPPAEVFDK